MTLDEVRRRVAEIEAEADQEDDEAAHAGEKELWGDVLEAIASDGFEERYTTARDLAQAALGTRKIRFSRWYA